MAFMADVPYDLQQSPTPWPVFGLQCLQQLLAYVAVASQARKIPRWKSWPTWHSTEELIEI